MPCFPMGVTLKLNQIRVLFSKGSISGLVFHKDNPDHGSRIAFIIFLQFFSISVSNAQLKNYLLDRGGVFRWFCPLET